jgi:hypothetical protein
VDAIPVDGFHFNDGGECGLSDDWSVRHDGAHLGSVRMVEGARVVLAEPRVLEGVGVVDFMCVGEEKPEMTEGLVWDELELGKSVSVGSRPSEVGDERSVRCLG